MPKRTNDVLTSYEFTPNLYYNILTIHNYRKNQPRSHCLSDASYARFVALANNSARYVITILDKDIVGWRIRRQPIQCAHNNYIACPFGCDPNGLPPQEEPDHGNPTPARPD